MKDAEKAALVGADALGFVFFRQSPRYISPKDAANIIRDLPPFINAVGVFVNEDPGFIEECIKRCGLRAVQLHGDEDAKYCLKFKGLRFEGVKLIKALRVKDRESISSIEECPVDAILLDSYKSNVYGGTGRGFDRDLAILAKEHGKLLIISGGLNPHNVYDVIKEIMPYGVDVSSGIESSPGRKNLELMEQFIQEVRRAEKE
jgi:phosphoribosylanthranilate isomerase